MEAPVFNGINPSFPPGPSSPWELWFYDTFDTKRPSFLDSRGTGALGGFCELWHNVLENGVMDNGNATFHFYELRFGEEALRRVAVRVAPFDNRALAKLRRWSRELSDHGNAGGGGTEPTSPGAGIHPIVRAVAGFHLRLLERSERWRSERIDMSAEAQTLLEWVELMTDPRRLDADLGEILPEM